MRLSAVLWMAFVLIIAGASFVLLRACGLLLPLVTAFPVAGWNFCPSTPLALSAEAERGAALSKLVRQLESEVARKSLACASIPKPPPTPLELPKQTAAPKPQQTALLKPPPPPPRPPEPPKPPPAFPLDRWLKKDLSLLNGCWVLGHDVPMWRFFNGDSGPYEECTAKAGRICFGDSGAGQREMSMMCPSGESVHCVAPIAATFAAGGSLHMTQPQVDCPPSTTHWLASTLDCNRTSGDQLSCDHTWEFHR